MISMAEQNKFIHFFTCILLFCKNAQPISGILFILFCFPTNFSIVTPHFNINVTVPFRKADAFFFSFFYFFIFFYFTFFIYDLNLWSLVSLNPKS